MDEITPVLTPPQSGALKKARQDAARALRADERLVTLVVSYLFCAAAVFALCFAVTVLSFFLLVSGTGEETLSMILCGLLIFFVTAFALFPLLSGHVRMAGMAACEREVKLADLFCYFASPRLWWRGVRIAFLWLLALLIPSLFAAPAIAIGNGELSLRRALVLSRGRVPIPQALAFWGWLLVRLVLGLATLGLLWLLYDAHHSTATYFALVLAENNKETV